MASHVGLLKMDGTLVSVGVPDKPFSIHPFPMIAMGRNYAGSVIGSIKETQEMLDVSALAVQGRAFCVSIPMVGMIASLNLGTSSGVVLYEITRQRCKFQEKLRVKISEKKASNTEGKARLKMPTR